MNIIIRFICVVFLVSALYGQDAQKTQQSSVQNQQSSQTPQQKNLQQLYERNPFGASTNSEQTLNNDTPTPTHGIELRSIYCVNNKWYFSIYDSAQEKSYTLTLGVPYSETIPYAVDFFDEETNSVSISSLMGSYTISLKERDELTGKPVVGTSSKKTAKVKTKRYMFTKTEAKR